MSGLFISLLVVVIVATAAWIGVVKFEEKYPAAEPLTKDQIDALNKAKP